MARYRKLMSNLIEPPFDLESEAMGSPAIQADQTTPPRRQTQKRDFDSGMHETPNGPTPSQIQAKQEMKVLQIIPTGQRCALTDEYHPPEMLQICHILPRKYPKVEINKLAPWWGLEGFKNMNLDTTSNLFILSAQYHILFDKCGETVYWCLLPSNGVLKEVINQVEAQSERDLSEKIEHPWTAAFKPQNFTYTIHSFHFMKGHYICRRPYVQGEGPQRQNACLEDYQEADTQISEVDGILGPAAEVYVSTMLGGNQGNNNYQDAALVSPNIHHWPYPGFPEITLHVHPYFVIADARRKFRSQSMLGKLSSEETEIWIQLDKIGSHWFGQYNQPPPDIESFSEDESPTIRPSQYAKRRRVVVLSDSSDM